MIGKCPEQHDVDDFSTANQSHVGLYITSSSVITEGPRDALIKSVEILSAAARLYEKSHLTRRIALSCGIQISPVGSLD